MGKDLIVFLSCIIGTFIVTVLLAYYSSCAAARIFNEQNSTHWSCGDFFWAADQINAGTQTIKLTK